MLYNPSSPGALELVVCFLFSDVDPAQCMFVEQTGPPLYVVLCPGWIKVGRGIRKFLVPLKDFSRRDIGY